MSIALILEVSSEASERSILSAAERLAQFWAEGKDTYAGIFQHSDMNFRIEISPNNTAIMAENIGQLQSIKIGARIFFFVVPSQNETCINQIVEFMNTIAQTTQAKFILSQEYETVYAVKSNGTIDYRNSFFSDSKTA
jgi:hypothetical protein